MLRSPAHGPLRAATLAATAALLVAGCSLGDDGGGEGGGPPQLGARSDSKQAAEQLGFPATATKNTIRVPGADPASDVAGAVRAVFPATSDKSRPAAVALVDSADWQGALAASVLSARPLGIPMLLSDGKDLPEVTKETLDRLKPKGSDLSKDAQVIRIGDEPPVPSGFRTAIIRGNGPYERAAAIDRYYSAARGEPSADVVLVSGERPEFAMPAAAWAARSGNSILLTAKDALAPPTIKALREHEKPDIFILGPESAISKKVEAQIKKAKLGRVRRIQGPNPVENAIAFARYDRSGFGWGVTVPGYNFTVANVKRPLDAAAAATLGTNGVFAPLLLTDDSGKVPEKLENYFLDVQPGFEDDPSVGVFNRVWILGDEKAMDLEFQGRLDEITELVPVQAGAP